MSTGSEENQGYRKGNTNIGLCHSYDVNFKVIGISKA